MKESNKRTKPLNLVLTLTIPGCSVYHGRLYMPSAPLAALKAHFPQSEVLFDDGSDPAALPVYQEPVGV